MNTFYFILALFLIVLALPAFALLIEDNGIRAIIIMLCSAGVFALGLSDSRRSINIIVKNLLSANLAKFEISSKTGQTEFVISDTTLAKIFLDKNGAIVIFP